MSRFRNLIATISAAARSPLADIWVWRPLSNAMRSKRFKRYGMLACCAVMLVQDSSAIDARSQDTPGFVARTDSLAIAPQSGPHRGLFDLGPLEGRKLGDLYAVYLGLDPNLPVPKMLKIDFDRQLKVLWKRKVARSPRNRVVTDTQHDIVDAYIHGTTNRMTIETYQQLLARESKALFAAIDWKRVCTMYFPNPKKDPKVQAMSDRKCAALRSAMFHFGGRSLVAYTGTELLPSSEGALNRDYLDFILRNAGREYLESIPAVFDPYLSFGPYQFTSNAVYDKDGRREGASMVNVALPKDLRIHGSVAMLRGSDHVHAAWLFAVHNLAMTIRALDAREFVTFERIAPRHALDIAQLIATCHNKPAVGRRGARMWLDNGGRLPYRNSLPSVSRIYATKTYNNYNALSPTKK